MKIKSLLSVCFLLSSLSFVHAAQLLEHVESESGSLLPGYTGKITSPFVGVGAYGNGDGVEHATIKLTNAPGIFRLDIRGASSANSAAGISAYINGKKVGGVSFANATPAVKSIEFSLDAAISSTKIKLLLETDTGANDTFLDWYELHFVGNIPPPPAAPTLPITGAFNSGNYRNLFAEAGYSQATITAKVNAAYNQLFHSSNKSQESGEAIFIEMPNDSSMAYIWDTGNNDVRSEGLSYGMMIAVQMNRQDDFNKLWKWATTYALNKSGDMKGYFAWQTTTAGGILDKNPAPDGEEYFVTALFFASNRWGDGTGIYNYRAQANKLLDDMYNNGQTRYNNQGQLENFSLFDHNVKQVVFSPATPSDRNWTDPSYHLPAFYELWARWADKNNDFWASLAVSSRAFLKTTVHPTTGLSPDYAYFDGRPHGAFQHWKDTFQYDAWRTVGNSSLDYAWFKKDEWAVTYAKRLQLFLKTQGVDSYSSLYELNGTPYQGNADHSPGLVAMNAVASLASNSADTWPFVKALWDTSVPTGRYRYYDGSLYMLGLLAVSGNYRIYCPNNGCINSSSSSSTSSSSSSSSSTSSSSSSSSSTSSSSSSGGSSSSAVSIGRIEAENYTEQSGVKSESTSDTGGGSNIGYIENNDYVEYQVNVPASGTYQMQFRVASKTSGGTINVTAKNTNVGSVSVTGTGGWQTWNTLSKSIQLTAGVQTIRLTFTGGSGFLMNLNWFNLSTTSSSSSSTSSSSNQSSNSSSSQSSSSSNAITGLTCSHIILNEWSQGFTAGVRVTNNTSSPITGWSATWKYTDGSVMTNSWNATVTGNNPYTAKPLSWLTTINPGQTVEVGVQGNKGSTQGATPKATISCN